jgi:Inner membrane protein YgaP-like, transmembrane domain
MQTTPTELAAHREARRNMNAADRWSSVAAGAALTLYGIGQGIARRRGLGLLFTIGGLLLVRRGATGYCDTYRAFGLDFRHRRRWGRDGDTRRALGHSAGVKVHGAVTVNRSAASSTSSGTDSKTCRGS